MVVLRVATSRAEGTRGTPLYSRGNDKRSDDPSFGIPGRAVQCMFRRYLTVR